jgi:hypothetical protein
LKHSSSKSDLIVDVIKPALAVAAVNLLEIELLNHDLLIEWSSALLSYLNVIEKTLRLAQDANAAIIDIHALAAELLSIRTQPIGSIFATLIDQSILDELDLSASIGQVVTGMIDPVSVTSAVAAMILRSNEELYTGVCSGHIPVDAVVEEALRMEAPFHFAPRIARVDIDDYGISVRKGDRIKLVLATPTTELSVLDIPSRMPSIIEVPRHLSFGRGRHHCIGASLARMCTAAVIESLVEADLVFRLDPLKWRIKRQFGATLLTSLPLT